MLVDQVYMHTCIDAVNNNIMEHTKIYQVSNSSMNDSALRICTRKKMWQTPKVPGRLNISIVKVFNFRLCLNSDCKSEAETKSEPMQDHKKYSIA